MVQIPVPELAKPLCAVIGNSCTKKAPSPLLPSQIVLRLLLPTYTTKLRDCVTLRRKLSLDVAGLPSDSSNRCNNSHIAHRTEQSYHGERSWNQYQRSDSKVIFSPTTRIAINKISPLKYQLNRRRHLSSSISVSVFWIIFNRSSLAFANRDMIFWC